MSDADPGPASAHEGARGERAPEAAGSAAAREEEARAARRSPLRHRDFRVLLCAAAAVFAGFALLLPVVPLWVVRGGGGAEAAGASTAVFMASTVAAQFAVVRLATRWGYRGTTALGALLLGLPALLSVAGATWPVVVGMSLLRGVGFGLVTVCCAALVAELLPRGALAGGSGLYGLAIGLPLLAGLPLGTWLAEHWGFVPVFVLAAALPVLGLLPVWALPRVAVERAGPARWLHVAPAVWRPWSLMLSGGVGYGSLVTFLPIAAAEPSAASLALLACSAGALLARWVAGLLGDRWVRPGRMSPVALLLTGGGVAWTGWALHTGSASGVFCAAALFGTGFGVVQNDSVMVMFTAAPTAPASVAWNVAYDAGTGLGAVLVGLLATASGYPLAFGLLALATLALSPVAWRLAGARARGGRGRGPGAEPLPPGA